MMRFIFLLFGVVIGWVLNSLVTQGWRIIEIKKLREELKTTSYKVGKLEKQKQRINHKNWLMRL